MRPSAAVQYKGLAPVSSVDSHLWQQVVQHVVAHGGQVLRPWFAQLEPLALEHGVLEIQAPGPREQVYCQRHAAGLFTEAAQLATGRLVSVCFLAASSQTEPGQPPGRPVWPGDSDLPLNPDYTFDTFITGPSNRLAQAACMAVAEAPGKTYNPLFIHGPPVWARRTCSRPRAGPYWSDPPPRSPSSPARPSSTT